VTVTISPTDPRSVRALAVLATADRWVKGHRRSDGLAFFAIPGSNGRVYNTTTRVCTCPDARERGATCKHQLAVRLWMIERKATAGAPAPADDPHGLATDAEVDEVMAGIVAKHRARAAAEAREARLAELARSLDMVEE
jgi:hypothetical protein